MWRLGGGRFPALSRQSLKPVKDRCFEGDAVIGVAVIGGEMGFCDRGIALLADQAGRLVARKLLGLLWFMLRRARPQRFQDAGNSPMSSFQSSGLLAMKAARRSMQS